MLEGVIYVAIPLGSPDEPAEREDAQALIELFQQALGPLCPRMHIVDGAAARRLSSHLVMELLRDAHTVEWLPHHLHDLATGRGIDASS